MANKRVHWRDVKVWDDSGRMLDGAAFIDAMVGYYRSGAMRFWLVSPVGMTPEELDAAAYAGPGVNDIDWFGLTEMGPRNASAVLSELRNALTPIVELIDVCENGECAAILKEVLTDAVTARARVDALLSELAAMTTAR